MKTLPLIISVMIIPFLTVPLAVAVMTASVSISLAPSASSVGRYTSKLKNKLNTDLSTLIANGKLTKSFSHKFPDFYFGDHTTNLLFLSDSIVEDLRFDVQGDASQGEYTTIPKHIRQKRNEMALGLLSHFADEVAIDFKGLRKSEAQRIMSEARANKVVGIASLDYYDPKDKTGHRNHGFCFGRADYIYFKLRQAGVPRSATAKIFQTGAISGDPDFGGPWSNHITTIVKAYEGGWWVMDPFYNLVAHQEQWVARNELVSKNGTFVFLGEVDRVNAQGGDHSYAGIHDRSFPVNHQRVTVDGVRYDSVNAPKRVGRYIEYYDDMFRELIRSNDQDADSDLDYCAEAGWDCP